MIQKYYYNNEITDSDIDKCIKIIDHLFESDQWCKNYPKYQTLPILFEYEEFSIFAKTFLNSCAKYLNVSEIHFEAVKSNCYKSDSTTYSDSFMHNHLLQGAHLSGIFYLKNEERIGTEFLSFPSILPEKYCWYIYPSFLYHRPQEHKSSVPKYTLSADLYLTP